MMPTDDYIKRSDAVARLTGKACCVNSPGKVRAFATAINVIEMMPAADVEPVRHGRWIPGKAVYSEYNEGRFVARYYDRWTCSVCNYVINDQHYSRISYKRCPECGAKMDKEADDV